MRRCVTTLFMICILTGTSQGAALVNEDCACNRGLSPVCSPTTGAYVSTSKDCAEQCEGVPDSVECLFFRYYSWRRRCSCSMYLPERFGGWCNVQTGAIASMDKACSDCKKMDPNAYADCDNLPDGVQPLLVQDTNAITLPPQCNATQEDYCSMAHGKKVADSQCDAWSQGQTQIIPCRYFQGHSAPMSQFYAESCLIGDDAAKHIGVVAGYAACMSTMHKCGIFQRVDGAMVHTMCRESESCMATAVETRSFWPECEAILNAGSADGACTKEKALTLWNEAVGELCKPFGPYDFPN